MELRIPSSQLTDLHRTMLAASPDEAAAFISAEPSGDALVVRSVRVFGQPHMEPGSGPLQLREDVQAAALAAMKRAGHTLIEVHTHPNSGDDVRFSPFDLEQLPAFARYVRLKMPGRGFGALVLGERGYQGLIWSGDSPDELTLRAIGERCAQPAWLAHEVTDRPLDTRYDRQVRALGADGQRRLSRLRVGIVGLGGTGSQVLQQLAHLGVRDFCLVDDDRVDWTNLPRLAGATRWDALLKSRKTRVARRLIRRLGGRARIGSFTGLRSIAALSALREVDIVIGCVDNDGARLVLSELAAAHLVPYLDVGVAIEPMGDSASLGGRVSFYLPGGPCLACADEIDFAEAAEDLESEALRGIRIARGYARDRGVEPALMPLNTVCVGLAMIEFLAFATGWRRVKPFARYDALNQRITRIRAELNPDCPVCQPAHGMGDRQKLDRFAA
jgi:molybdopterin/thiamine biosynthesis adenylyltransferase